MIALDRELPKECIGCPCLLTTAVPIDESRQRLFRACSAYSTKIIVRKDYVIGEDIPKEDEWFSFSKPEWCPWIELEDKKGGK